MVADGHLEKETVRDLALAVATAVTIVAAYFLLPLLLPRSTDTVDIPRRLASLEARVASVELR